MKSIITVKTNSQIKQKAAKLAAEFGLSLSDIINISLAQFVQTKSLHIGTSEQPNQALQKVISQAQANLQAGKASPVFDNPEDAFRYLDL